MALVHMKEILQDAHKNAYGVGAFSVLSSDALQGIILAAEEKKSPLILQMAEVRAKTAPIDVLGAALIAAAKKTRVPTAVHLDHGISDEVIHKALDTGFTSIMIDASAFPLEENIARTVEVAQYARRYGVTIEAELGRIGGSEGGETSSKIVTTEVNEAITFVKKAQPDVLAVAIGNVHGPYKGTPQLQIPLLQELHEALQIPLVLHGGSGIDMQGFRACIANGICKINIATAMYAPSSKNVQEHNLSVIGKEESFIELQQVIIETARQQAMSHMDMFLSSGKA